MAYSHRFKPILAAKVFLIKFFICKYCFWKLFFIIIDIENFNFNAFQLIFDSRLALQELFEIFFGQRSVCDKVDLIFEVFDSPQNLSFDWDRGFEFFILD